MTRFMGTRGRLATTAALAIAAVITATVSAESIDIRLESASNTYVSGDTFDVDIIASASTLLVGYGFDLLTDNALTLTGFNPGDGFVGVGNTPDGDRLAGLSFSGGVDGVDFLLGTAGFVAGSPGDVSIELSTTDGDLTEGFAQFGTGFFDIITTSLDLTITGLSNFVNNDSGASSGGGGSAGGGGGGGNPPPPVPEPVTVMLLVTGLFAVIRRR